MTTTSTAAMRELLRDFPGELRLDEPLSRHLSYGVGGPADGWCIPESVTALRDLLTRARRLGIPVLVLGRGTNVVVADQGFRGLVINLERACAELRAADQRVTAGAGVLLQRLVLFCEERGLGGVECLSGIPGTIGGALVMNAGAFTGEIGDRILEVRALRPEGAEVTVPRAEAGFGYRQALRLRGLVLLECDLLLAAEAPAELRRRREEFLARRAARQPLHLPSAGSVFKRPPGDYAGRLIEAAGCKGRSEGGAEVSDKHANFILNRGGATAADIRRLVERVRERVFRHCGVWLEPEIEFIGFAEGPPTGGRDDGCSEG